MALLTNIVLITATLTATSFVMLVVMLFINAILAVSRESDPAMIRAQMRVATLMLSLTISQVLWLAGAFS